MWFYILIGALLLFFLLYYHFSTKGTTLTGRATVVSHRLELGKGGGRYGDNWNRLVTFRLSDGDELELYVDRQAYELLKDGQTGQLTWEKDQLRCFDTDD